MPRSKNKRKKSASAAAPTLDLRTLEAMLSQIGHFESDDALDAAQAIVFDAWEARDRRRRIALAKEALALSPLCADAHLLLAEEAETPDEAIALCREAVQAGERALGTAAFEDDVGDFWGLIETRPYMRARHTLAIALWQAGERDEAVIHYQDMLRLNPDDNQGIRYLLLDALLELGRDDEAGELLERYDEGSAAWAWSKTLLSFRREGDCAASREALARAIEANRHVPAYLFGRKKLPRTLPDYIGWGDQNEAVSYVYAAAGAWAAAAGALAWAQAVAGGKPARAPQERDLQQMQLDIAETVRPGLDQIDDAVLALLLLGRHNGDRVWKAFDWNAMDRLHRKGYISDPVGKAKSVVLTEEGLQKAERLFKELFPKAASHYP